MQLFMMRKIYQPPYRNFITVSHGSAYYCVHCCNGNTASQWEMAILGYQNSVTTEQIEKN